MRVKARARARARGARVTRLRVTEEHEPSEARLAAFVGRTE